MTASGVARLLRAAGVLLVVGLFLGPIATWPWDHDEVHSLVELGQVSMEQYPGPTGQLERMHRLVPVWTLVQNAVLLVLPANEWGTRVLPAICGVMVVIGAFVVGRRCRGVWFGSGLALMAGGSQTLIWLSQQNRFYSLALLFLGLTFTVIWSDDSRRRYDLLAVVFGLCAVLSHNLTMILLGLAAASTTACWLLGSERQVVARRAIVSASAAVLLYLMYLRPNLVGWVSGGTGGTWPLVSFVAQAGIVPVGLSALGAVVALRERRLHSWVTLLFLSVMFVAAAPWILGNWNPRYGLFFMVPLWVIAAAGVSSVAHALEAAPLRAAWFLALVVLLAPKVASHFVDGSRHDFRRAAIVVAQKAPALPVMSNWPATLQYYLDPATGQKPTYWTPGERLPDHEAVIVMASNVWDVALSVEGSRLQLIGEVGRRRFDEQSHLIRIYRLSPR